MKKSQLLRLMMKDWTIGILAKKTKRINAPFRSLPMSPLAVSACCPGINIPETSVA